MWAMVVKEFRQLRRDRRTIAMMIVMPLLMLVVFGYAASFDLDAIATVVVGRDADAAADRLPALFDVVAVDADGNRDGAVAALRDGDGAMAVVADPATPEVLIDGSQLFSARQAVAAVERGAPQLPVTVLFNPDLETSVIMVPAIAGMILVFIGTLITSLGVVRERQSGTLEQLAVMPFRPYDVFVGKVAPYFAVAAIDMVIVVVAGMAVFDVPFRGSVATFALGSVLFLFVTLGLGVLISTVSENQGQAIQLSLMTLLPQVLLSGMIFPLSAMPVGVRAVAYVLPLTYFIEIARGVMVRATPLEALTFPLVMLGVLGVVVFGLAVARFRRDVVPTSRHRPGHRRAPHQRHAAGRATG